MSTRLTVTGTSWVTPALRRVHFRSDDLSAFAESIHTDRYVKLIFPKPGVDYPEPIDMRQLRRTMPGEQLPDVRTYTVLNPDVAAGTLDIDFVVHGDVGVAGPWAQRAEAGMTLDLNGPGGAYRPDPEADWHLLAGDEAAVPAIAAARAALDDDAIVRTIVLVEDADHEPALPGPWPVTFLHRADDAGKEVLAEAIRGLDWPAGRVHAFVHGEAQEVMHSVRPYLLKERGLDRKQVLISGYWRRGRTEEGFREWKAELAAAEGEGR